MVRLLAFFSLVDLSFGPMSHLCVGLVGSFYGHGPSLWVQCQRAIWVGSNSILFIYLLSGSSQLIQGYDDMMCPS